MAKVHVLPMTPHGHFNVLVHFNAPSGDNSVGVAWKTAALAAGVTGNEAHSTISDPEKALIEAGDIVELRTTITVNPENVSGQDLVDAVDAAAEVKKAAWITEQQVALQYYGYSQGTVS